mmetsp:Transcript_69421/g.144772  ORF Transcript_69421/g.144772 Transcript_69421/m.144772 type:complete len:191 (-) Transcript_69421:496-1068(-)
MKAKDQKIKALEARLAGTAPPGPGTKPSFAPKTPGSQPKSVLRDGTREAPDCSECHTKHFGKCPSKRNFKLERKQLEADEARWKRQQGQEKERAAANTARDLGAWETASNESDSEYLRVSVYDPVLPTPAHIRVSVNKTYLTKKQRRASGCIDSWSMVNLSGDEQHIREMLEGEVMVKGAHGDSRPDYGH